LGPLGQGTQGATYRVFDLHQQEVVALKLLVGTLNVGPWHEAAILTRLRDERILPVRNADFASGIPYVVTELAHHGTIQDKINARRTTGLDPATALRWIRQACQATARTHDAGLLHTDIKPENLFVDEHQDVRLGDYGLASLIDAAGQGHCSGTPATMAPEVAQAMLNQQTQGTSRRSDVYSLGATLYWMLSGQPAFQAAPGAVDLAAIAANSPRKLRDLAPHVPQALSQKVEKAMASDPAARHASPGELAAVLGSIPAPSRAWVRSDEHPGHLGCWRGVSGKSAIVLVCAVVAGNKVETSAVKLPRQRKIRGTSMSVTKAQLPAALRKVFRLCS
jgi:eukaryotic-like serine/threonine-protein kinase